MALRFIDSFEVYDTPHIYEKWTSFINNSGDNVIHTASTTGVPAARTGTGCMGITNGGVFKTIDNQTTWIVGGAFYWPAVSNGGGVAIVQVNTLCVKWLMEPDGRIQVIPGVGGGTTTGTSGIVISDNSWNYVEAFFTLGTAGTAIVKINGTTAVSMLGVNLCSNTTADVVNFVGGGGGNPTFIDDVYVFDTNANFTVVAGTTTTTYTSTCTTFAGDSRIGTLTASADTTTIQWATSTGTVHFSLVDEQPPDDDTSYVQTTMTGTSTTGPQDLYKFTPVSGTVGVIIGAQSNIFARKTDASNRAITLITSNSQGSSTGDQKYLNFSYIDYLNQFDVNPNGGGTWTPAVLNTTSWGVQVVV